jgi:hypothetical protein
MVRTGLPSTPPFRKIASPPYYDDSEDVYEVELETATEGTMARFSATRLRTRHRVVLFVFVAFAVVLLPFMTLYVFDGMERKDDRLGGSVGSDHDDEWGGSAEGEAEHEVGVVEGPMMSSVVEVSASSSVSSSVLSTSASSLPSVATPLRLDLPVRQLTQYVSPLIGTEGKGHGTL